MSALFSPIRLRGLELQNRIMVAPMCQYSATDGAANDWHFVHINTLALSGAALFCIEATHVEAIGRITPGCLGLWNDPTEQALRPILAALRKHSKTKVAMQLAHAGRKGSSHVPWNGGQQIPLVAEVLVESTAGHVGGLHDVVDAGAAVSAGAELCSARIRQRGHGGHGPLA